MEQQALHKLIKLTRAHEKSLEPRAAIYAAMKEFGISEKDPARPEIFKDIAKGVAMERAAERKEALQEMSEIKAALEEEKQKERMAGAYQNQARHPMDTYRNL